MNCFGCGDEGHIERDCPNTGIAGPPWCGICDIRTRLVGTGDGKVKRCPECHPLRHQHLRQFRRCPACKMIIHEWDTNPCGHHSSPVAEPHRLPLEQIREITRSQP